MRKTEREAWKHGQTDYSQRGVGRGIMVERRGGIRPGPCMIDLWTWTMKR